MIMNKLSQVALTAAVAAVGFAAATAASAQEATYDYPVPAVSTVTRAQVQAELAQAKLDGSMRVWSSSYDQMAAAKSVKTRDQVRAELLGANHAALAAMIGEDSGSFALSRLRRAAPADAVVAGR